ncbi:MAG: hypothetical protein K6U74_16750 [Firmicutes bacterium]|nr:hypothetical protein [Bacillota bacterium]
MRVLINAAPEKQRVFQTVTGIEFGGYHEKREKSVAVVVRCPAFSRDLQEAVRLMVPVVVIAGREDETGRKCVGEALALGVAKAAVVVVKNDRVVTLDGRDIGPERGGVGVNAVVTAARFAFDNGLVPEPLVWVDSSDEPVLDVSYNRPVFHPDEAVVSPEPPKMAGAATAKPAKISSPPKKYSGKAHGEDVSEIPLSTVLDMAEHIAVAYRAGESGRVAKQIAADFKGVHLELSPEPQSFALYANTLGDAVKTGKYIYSNGNLALVSGYMGADWLVVEADISDQNVEALDAVQNRAERVYIVAGDNVEDARHMVEMFKENGWRLDGVLPASRESSLLIKNTFGEMYARAVVNS